MSGVITKIKKIWERLSDKEYRDAYVEAHISATLEGQIYALREQREWTQKDLADKAGMLQPRISKLEEDCSNVSLNTLRKIASAFDVALSVRFVPYSRLVRESTATLDELIPSYDNDYAPMSSSTHATTPALRTGKLGIFMTSSGPSAHKLSVPLISERTYNDRYIIN